MTRMYHAKLRGAPFLKKVCMPLWWGGLRGTIGLTILLKGRRSSARAAEGHILLGGQMREGKRGLRRPRAKQHYSYKKRFLGLAAALAVIAVPGYLQIGKSQQEIG